MHFKISHIMTLVLATAQAQAAINPNDIVPDLNTLTRIVIDTNQAAAKLSAVAFTSRAASVTNVFIGVQRIVNGVNAEIAKLSEAPPAQALSRTQQINVCSAFTSFVNSHVQLIQTMQDNEQYFYDSSSLTGLNGSFGKLLSMVGLLGDKLLVLVPTCASDADSQLGVLEDWIRSGLYIFQP